MPDYIAPGVYVEETGGGGKSIAGVSTTTTAFVGPTRFGPTGNAPVPLMSYSDFERTYGGAADFGFTPALNFIAQGVRAFFNEGGTRLYVARTAGKSKTAAGAPLIAGQTCRFVARFPGAAGNGQVTVQFATPPASIATASMTVDGSFLRIKSSPPLCLVKQQGRWHTSNGSVHALTAADETTGLELILLQVTTLDADGHSNTYADLGLDAHHPHYLATALKKNPVAADDQAAQPFAFEVASTVKAFDLFAALAPDSGGNAKTIPLTGGTDVAPTLTDYTKAFTLLADLPDVSIVAAPGHTAFGAKLAGGIARQLVAHAEQLRYRVAVLDSPAGLDVTAVQTYRAGFDSPNAALYYPWVITPNPAYTPATPGTPLELTLPPSAFICGIYVRCDLARGVFKSPANEPIQSAQGFERGLSDTEEGVLNPLGINCLRTFPGKGNLVWGARTLSSDLEWKYVSVRRYFIYLERSIDLGTQWAVFETNGEPLWVSVRNAVETFLLSEWRLGALAGDKPAQAFYVQCDRNTMTQADVDNGRLVCVIGFAPLRPAEFVLFRITQLTTGVT